MRNLGFAIIVFAAASVFSAPPADAGPSDLASFLERAERMFAHNRPVRADITIHRNDGSNDSAVLIIDPETNRQFFALKSTGWRALSPLNWTPGKAIEKAGASPVDHGADELLAGTDLRAMEFFVFWKTDYSKAFISDDSRLEKTISLYADDTLPYRLFVVTLDKTRMIPVLTKYYKDSLRNLVRIRRDSDHVMVGSRPRPQKIVITDYSENRESTFELSWHALESLPEGLMTDTAFNKAAIDWPQDSLAGG